MSLFGCGALTLLQIQESQLQGAACPYELLIEITTGRTPGS
jgi:hypothetical protein